MSEEAISGKCFYSILFRWKKGKHFEFLFHFCFILFHLKVTLIQPLLVLKIRQTVQDRTSWELV